MKCITMKHGVDICVTVDVKLIYPASTGSDISSELIRKDTARKAQYIGTRHEQQIAETIKEQMAGEDLGVRMS